MWRKIDPAPRDEMRWLRYMARMKLYADEDIEEEVIQSLRSKGVNIKSARELGHTGKPDSFHSALAYKDGRFLLTKNAKHYMDDREIPFHSIRGVIAVVGSMASTEDYARVFGVMLTYLIPFAEIHQGAKVRVSPKEIVSRFRDYRGRVVTQRIRLEPDGDYEWVDESEEDT